VFSSFDPAKRKVKNIQVKMVGARNENTLIGDGPGRNLINKTSPAVALNSVFSLRSAAVLFLKSRPVPPQGEVFFSLNFAPQLMSVFSLRTLAN
jgi:hypothetical protein